jgi:hypothetical protein
MSDHGENDNLFHIISDTSDFDDESVHSQSHNESQSLSNEYDFLV